MALKMRKFSEEAARGALKAVHASAGLARQTSPEASALLRAAEGLVRAAVAVLQSPALADGSAEGGKPPAKASASGPGRGRKLPGSGSSRAARRRRQRRQEKAGEMVAGIASWGARAEFRVTSEQTSAAAAVVASEGPRAGSEDTSVLSQAVLGQTSVQTSNQTLVCGDSVLYGDLTEFGVGAAGASGSAVRPRSLPLGPPPEAFLVPPPGYLQLFLEQEGNLPVEVQRRLWRNMGFGDLVVDDMEI